MRGLRNLPLLVILMGLTAPAMLVPMALAVRLGDFRSARVFLESGILIFLFVALVAVASQNRPVRRTGRDHLMDLLGAYVVLPALLALPLVFLVPTATFSELYFEMLSSLTTTGASLFDHGRNLGEPIDLWRGFVGWLGGLLILVSAFAILAPLNLGGFEIYSSKAPMPGMRGGFHGHGRGLGVSGRMARSLFSLGPIYLGLTVILSIALLLSGERAFSAVMKAMATLSTSGITGAGDSHGGLGSEILIFLFLLLAISRRSFTNDNPRAGLAGVFDDHEFRLAGGLMLFFTLLLFLRHWVGAIGVEAGRDSLAALRALWGSLFTTLSFLTTTGFESVDWHAAREWSGLGSSGIILLFLSGIGGGVATTAGGIKLLRAYAIYQHSMREFRKLTYPSSVGGAGQAARHIRREGAYAAWMFLVLFVSTVTLVMLALALTGVGFVDSLALSVAALSTNGPLLDAVREGAFVWGDLDGTGRLILGLAMILGRMEIFVIIALVSPEFWRR